MGVYLGADLQAEPLIVASRLLALLGPLGHSRPKLCEHLCSHHRCYRITGGAEQIHRRMVAGHLFGCMAAHQS